MQHSFKYHTALLCGIYFIQRSPKPAYPVLDA